MSVINHDFGLTKHQTARRFRELLSLDALHDANVRANPIPYLERASERIFQLEKTLFEAAQAAEPSSGEPFSSETIEVERRAARAALHRDPPGQAPTARSIVVGL